MLHETEKNRDEALRVSALGTRNATLAAGSEHAKPIYIGTAYVFAGVRRIDG